MAVVKKQLDMLRFRTTFPAFAFDSDFRIESRGEKMFCLWQKEGCRASLEADLKSCSFKIKGMDGNENCIFEMAE